MTSTPPLLLASTSPSRRSILTSTGFAFGTQAPEVDERAEVEALRAAGELVSPGQEAQLLGTAKSRAVAATPEAAGRVVLGCDSVFELDGVAYGKPHLPEVALERWRGMSGRTGVLHTGHHLVDVSTGREASRLVSTAVTFAEVSEDEIRAYVASGEPLECAGAFTVDGLAAAFVTRLEGDVHAVVGLSPAALRSMASELGIPLAALWAAPAA
ncbi:septum formation protein Maf [Galactobacter valiniphilus]|uniref:Nucleoside triphosphate pyrophosphatase n=1 Tax=Galactobacter valiniphilus TaxID=2676122 RepID=A0A399J8Q6_9MICC|nr:Maf family protein [Galactobacter valiniphilus]RII41953.1 septum formation protein Maf [Galactobacter valiniphilus]